MKFHEMTVQLMEKLNAGSRRYCHFAHDWLPVQQFSQLQLAGFAADASGCVKRMSSAFERLEPSAQAALQSKFLPPIKAVQKEVKRLTPPVKLTDTPATEGQRFMEAEWRKEHGGAENYPTTAEWNERIKKKDKELDAIDASYQSKGSRRRKSTQAEQPQAEQPQAEDAAAFVFPVRRACMSACACSTACPRACPPACLRSHTRTHATYEV